MVKIKRMKGGGEELDIKRCYVPFKVSAPCPECGKKCTTDLRSDYLSHPVLGQPEEVHMYCGCKEDDPDDCAEGFYVRVILDVTLVPAP